MSLTEAPVAARLVEALRLLGARTVFGLPGAHNLALWEEVRRSDVDLVGVRHEQTAGYAADGFARVGGGLGVALTTTGPGAANVIAATGEAWASGSPLLVVATDVPAALRRPGRHRGLLHETRDQAAMFAPVVKGLTRIDDPDRAGEALLRAGELALAAPRGPVYVEVPTDFLARPAAALTAGREPAPPAAPPAADLDAAAALLERAASPLLWLGRGAVDSGAGAAAEELAGRLGAPVIETFAARGAISPAHPSWIGLSAHLPEVGELWDRADLVLAVGANLGATSTQNWAMPRPPRLVAVNVDPEATEYEPDLTLVGDAGETLRALLARLPDGAPRAGLGAALRDRREAALERLRADDAAAMGLLDDLAAAVPAEVPVAADMCVAGYWVAAARRFAAPARLAYPMGWGTLGFAFPAALGVAVAAGPTLCVCGDGGFLYACGELSTLAERGLPVTVLLVDDGGYGMLRYGQEAAGRKVFGVDFPSPDFVALARSFGIEAVRLERGGAALREALAAGLAAGGPRLVVLEAALRPPPTTSPRWYRVSR